MEFSYHILEFAREFQTGIIGVVGFLGVIATLKANAHLAREMEESQYNRRRNFVKTAVIEELKLFHWIFENGHRDMEPKQGESLLVPKMNRLVTSELMSELAVLEPEDMKVALMALFNVDEVYKRLAIIGKPSGDHYFAVSSAAYHSLKKINEDAAAKLKIAIETIEAGSVAH